MQRGLLKKDLLPIKSYKLNIDVVVFFDLVKVGYGAIVLDWRGTTPLPTSVADTYVAQLEIVKALSILKGLQLCIYQGFDLLIIESDCLLVIEEISKQ